jgi:hypothetical protein
MTKDQIIEDALSSLEDVVYECSQAKHNEPDQYNSLAQVIEQRVRGDINRIKRSIEQEKTDTICRAFGIQ